MSDSRIGLAEIRERFPRYSRSMGIWGRDAMQELLDEVNRLSERLIEYDRRSLVTFDPDDPEVRKRVTLSLYPAFISHPGFADHAARAVLSALKASG